MHGHVLCDMHVTCHVLSHAQVHEFSSTEDEAENSEDEESGEESDTELFTSITQNVINSISLTPSEDPSSQDPLTPPLINSLQLEHPLLFSMPPSRRRRSLRTPRHMTCHLTRPRSHVTRRPWTRRLWWRGDVSSLLPSLTWRTSVCGVCSGKTLVRALLSGGHL